LGICRGEDWSGSAVDFVERGFTRFAKLHGAEEAAKVWDGWLRIMDYPFYVTELERNQSRAEMDATPNVLYLLGEYSAAASIPIGPALHLLEREHERLPAAFYSLFVHNLWLWMRVYDYESARSHAEMWLEDLDEKEAAESVYSKVGRNIPLCLSKTGVAAPRAAVRFLHQLQPQLRTSVARQLVQQLLEMHSHGKGHAHAWPGKLAETVPGLQEFLSDADEPGPGCLITWHEDDEISACFEEEMQILGQNAPMEPCTLLTISIDKSPTEVDADVKRVFGYAGAMLRSLASASRIIGIIRELHDEHVRRNRLQSGLPAAARPAGLRGE